MRRSPVYRAWKRTFFEISGLPLFLESIGETAAIDSEEKPLMVPQKNAFCGFVNGTGRSCLRCPLSAPFDGAPPKSEKATRRCAASFLTTRIAVPVGDEAAAWLTTGQIAARRPCETSFREVETALHLRGLDALLESGEKRLQDAFRSAPRMPEAEYGQMIGLLEAIAVRLGGLLNAMLIEIDREDSFVVAQIKEILRTEFGCTGEVSLNLPVPNAAPADDPIHAAFEAETGIPLATYALRCRLEPARVYAIKENTFAIWRTKAVGYVWSGSEPVGMIAKWSETPSSLKTRPRFSRPASWRWPAARA